MSKKVKLNSPTIDNQEQEPSCLTTESVQDQQETTTQTSEPLTSLYQDGFQDQQPLTSQYQDEYQDKRNENQEEKDLETNQRPIFSFPEHLKDYYLDEAKSLGFWDWLEKYQDYELSSLFSLFDIQLPPELASAAPEELLPILRYAFAAKAAKRRRLPDYETIQDAVQLIQKSKNILVLTGAGCSVSCGIPDFRSKNGIYSRLEEFDLTDPQEMFDIRYFRIRPETFYSFAHVLELTLGNLS